MYASNVFATSLFIASSLGVVDIFLLYFITRMISRLVNGRIIIKSS